MKRAETAQAHTAGFAGGCAGFSPIGTNGGGGGGEP